MVIHNTKAMKRYSFSKYHQDALMAVEIFTMTKFDIPKRTLYSSLRSKDVSAARFVAYYLLSTVYHFQSTLIGEIFNRTHASVLNGLEKIAEWGWQDEILRQYKLMYPFTGDKPVDN